jgi:chromosome segregation ATPase
VKRRQERAEADQNIMVAQLASKLMRQVAWLNSTFAASNSQMVSAVQGSLGQEMAKLQRKLGAVRGKTLTRLTQQKAALEALDKGQANAIQALKNQLAALQVRLKQVEDYSRGRTSQLVQDTKDAEVDLRARLKRMMEERKEQTLRIKKDTDQTYERLQDDWTQRVETQRQWLTRSLESKAASIERRLNTLSSQLTNTITQLEARLGQQSTTNDRKQEELKRRIALATSRRGEVEELEAQVGARLQASKASLVSFNTDMAQLEENTKTEVAELERKIDLNQGITTSTDELVRTLQALKRDVRTLRTQENQRDGQLKQRMRDSKRKADTTESYLRDQLRRLERMLEHDSNERRRGRAQTQAKAEGTSLRACGARHSTLPRPPRHACRPRRAAASNPVCMLASQSMC